MEAAVTVWNETQKKMELFLGEEDTEAILRIGSKLQTLKEAEITLL